MNASYHPYHSSNIWSREAKKIDLGQFKEMGAADCQKEKQRLILLLNQAGYYFFKRVGTTRRSYRFADGAVVHQHSLLFMHNATASSSSGYSGYVVLRENGYFHEVQLAKTRKKKGEFVKSIYPEDRFELTVQPIWASQTVFEAVQELTKVTHKLSNFEKHPVSLSEDKSREKSTDSTDALSSISSSDILTRLSSHPSPAPLAEASPAFAPMLAPAPAPTLDGLDDLSLSRDHLFLQHLDVARLEEVSAGIPASLNLSPLSSIPARLDDCTIDGIVASLFPQETLSEIQEAPEEYGRFFSRILPGKFAALPDSKTVALAIVKSSNEAIFGLKSHLKDEGYIYVERSLQSYCYLNHSPVSAESLIFRLERISALGSKNDLFSMRDDHVFECIVSSERVNSPGTVMCASFTPSEKVIKAIVLLKRLLQLDKELSSHKAYLQSKGYVYKGRPVDLNQDYSFLSGGAVDSGMLILELAHLSGYFCGVDNRYILHGVALTEALAKTQSAYIPFRSNPVAAAPDVRYALSRIRQVVHDQDSALKHYAFLSASFVRAGELRRQDHCPVAPSFS